MYFIRFPDYIFGVANIFQSGDFDIAAVAVDEIDFFAEPLNY